MSANTINAAFVAAFLAGAISCASAQSRPNATSKASTPVAAESGKVFFRLDHQVTEPRQGLRGVVCLLLLEKAADRPPFDFAVLINDAAFPPIKNRLAQRRMEFGKLSNQCIGSRADPTGLGLNAL